MNRRDFVTRLALGVAVTPAAVKAATELAPVGSTYLCEIQWPALTEKQLALFSDTRPLALAYGHRMSGRTAARMAYEKYRHHRQGNPAARAGGCVHGMDHGWPHGQARAARVDLVVDILTAGW